MPSLLFGNGMHKTVKKESLVHFKDLKFYILYDYCMEYSEVIVTRNARQKINKLTVCKVARAIFQQLRTKIDAETSEIPEYGLLDF